MEGRIRIDPEAEKKVNEWNEKYSVGTKVQIDIYPDVVKKTRTKARVQFGFKATLELDWSGHGYFELDQLTPVSDEVPVTDHE